MFPYDTSTLGRFMAKIATEKMRGIWVYEKTLTVTNGHMLMRRFCEAPDGFYRVGAASYLEPIAWIPDFPHVEQFKGRFLYDPKKHVCGELLNRDIRGEMMKVCHEATEHRTSVTLGPSGIWGTSVPAIHFDFPFQLPMTLEMNPEYLLLALTEMARYDGINLIKDGDSTHPLILGLNWGSCAIIMPLRGKS